MLNAAQGNAYVPRPLLDQIEQELEPGERVVWLDAPTPRFFTGASTAAFLFAIPWTGFSVFWTVGALWATRSAGGDLPGMALVFPLFGLPFVLVGLGMLSAPLFAYRKSLKTVYALTDRRAITIDGGWNTTVRSYPPEKLQDVFRRDRRDGTGDIIIARRAWRDQDGDQRTEELGFLRVRNPREVEDMLNELGARARVSADTGGDRS